MKYIYFQNVDSVEELKKQYKTLAFKYHPDREGGSVAAMQRINAEYDELLKAVRNVHKTADGKTYIILKNSGSVNVETAPAPAIGLEIACKVQLYGENKASPPDTLAKGTISAQEEERLSQLLTGYARSLWQTCAQAECDLLFFRRSLQRSSMEVYGKWKDIPLISVSADISARVRSLK